ATCLHSFGRKASGYLGDAISPARIDLLGDCPFTRCAGTRPARPNRPRRRGGDHRLHPDTKCLPSRSVDTRALSNSRGHLWVCAMGGSERRKRIAHPKSAMDRLPRKDILRPLCISSLCNLAREPGVDSQWSHAHERHRQLFIAVDTDSDNRHPLELRQLHSIREIFPSSQSTIFLDRKPTDLTATGRGLM